MGSIVKKAVGVSNSVGKKIDPFRGGDALLEANGIKTFTGEGSNNIFDNGATAAAKAAAEQARVTQDAADKQAAATKAASVQQAASMRDQAVASQQAQVAAINQSAQAAQLQAQVQAAPQEGAPDIQLDGFGDGSDPRRRYQGGGAPTIGGTVGGVGIRL